MMKGNEMSLNEVWASIYWTFQDNAFDYSKGFYLEDGVYFVDGKRFAEIPF